MISGIGGILLNDKDEIIFVLSGKCNSSSPVEAELEAIIFLANAALTHLDHTSKVVICTDCALAVQSLSKLRAGQDDFFRRKTEWVYLASKKMIQLYYTPREKLAMVDELANKGRERVKEFWKYDMGLGAIAEEFEKISEEDYLAGEIQEAEEMEEVQGDDDEGMQLVEDIEMDGMGHQG
ncbi:hypothetical protein POM88_029451 [Heracleum sosnowskyi]|uniref:RNase H type-1 domain-containing protein n=1 Tax=Heracleum sosnowskyi TaxID=360622 RepID=A0AAD8HVS9_9APIA|nr:hypothetical protein POM88_029451 [Heracleum sosnowskyi]